MSWDKPMNASDVVCGILATGLFDTVVRNRTPVRRMVGLIESLRSNFVVNLAADSPRGTSSGWRVKKQAYRDAGDSNSSESTQVGTEDVSRRTKERQSFESNIRPSSGTVSPPRELSKIL